MAHRWVPTACLTVWQGSALPATLMTLMRRTICMHEGQGLRPYIKDAQRLLIRARSERSTRIKQARAAPLPLPPLRCCLPSLLATATGRSLPVNSCTLQDKLDFLHLPILDGNVSMKSRRDVRCGV